jgi:hypothetical protein
MPHLKLVFAMSVFAFPLLAGAAGCSATSGAQRVALLELYTP